MWPVAAISASSSRTVSCVGEETGAREKVSGIGSGPVASKIRGLWGVGNIGILFPGTEQGACGQSQSQ